MPIRPFKSIPKDVVEWGRFFQSTSVTPDDGSVGPDAIPDASITYGKLQDVTPNRLLGRDSAPAGAAQELEVTGGLEFTGSGIQRSALTGDVTANAGSNDTVITDKAVTYAKIQDVTVTDRLLGRKSSGAGTVEEITCTAAGRALLDDADASTQRTTLGLASGVYIPSLTNTTNVAASTAYECQYLRIGAIVHVSGRLDIDPTAAALTELGMSLPVASDFGATEDLAGCGFCTAVQQGTAIFGDAVNNRAFFRFLANDTANRDFFFTFTYQVI